MFFVKFQCKNAFEIPGEKSYNIGKAQGRSEAMFQINDVIVYGTQGVCKIAGTEEKSVGGKKKTLKILNAYEGLAEAVEK